PIGEGVYSCSLPDISKGNETASGSRFNPQRPARIQLNPESGTVPAHQLAKPNLRRRGLEPDGGTHQAWIFEGFASAGVPRGSLNGSLDRKRASRGGGLSGRAYHGHGAR